MIAQHTAPLSRFRHLELLFLLGMLQAFAPVSIDMYLPAMPRMEQVFHASAAAVQSTMVTFLIGFALGQSLYGPITDRFGRKPPLYASLALFIVSSAACALAPSIRIMAFFGCCKPSAPAEDRSSRAPSCGIYSRLRNCAASFRC